MQQTDTLARLEADGLLRSTPDGTRTTARFQAAMARAAARLYREEAPWQDLRLPIATALLEVCHGLADDELADRVEALLSIEQRELFGAAATGDASAADSIDERYGLEPVIEPGLDAGSSPAAFVNVQCPYCGEHFETAVDTSAGSFNYIEDCQVCCQPIELAATVDDAGAISDFTARRA